MPIEVKDVLEIKTMEVKINNDGHEKVYAFVFDDKNPAEAELRLGDKKYKVEELRKVIAAFIEKYPIDLDL